VVVSFFPGHGNAVTQAYSALNETHKSQIYRESVANRVWTTQPVPMANTVQRMVSVEMIQAACPMPIAILWVMITTTQSVSAQVSANSKSSAGHAAGSVTEWTIVMTLETVSMAPGARPETDRNAGRVTRLCVSSPITPFPKSAAGALLIVTTPESVSMARGVRTKIALSAGKAMPLSVSSPITPFPKSAVADASTSTMMAFATRPTPSVI